MLFKDRNSGLSTFAYCKMEHKGCECSKMSIISLDYIKLIERF